MDPELSTRLTALEQKVDALGASLEKIRKYFLWTGIISAALFILPILGILAFIPSLMSSYEQLDSIDALMLP